VLGRFFMPESEQPPEQDRYRGLLGRMEHAVQQRTEAESGLNKEGIRLLDRAITALFEDCVDAGCKEEAHKILVKYGLEKGDEEPDDDNLQPA